MKKLSYLILLCIGLSSCLEEIEGPDNQFIKIYGKESESQGFGLREMDDGSIFILGQTATAGFDFELVSGDGLQLTSNTIFRAPSITITDQSGNLMERFLFAIPPFENGLDLPLVEFIDPNKAVFKDIMPLRGGGYFVIGEWLGLDLIPNVFGQQQSSFAFGIWLDENFKFERFESYAGIGDFGSNDNTVKVAPRFLELPDGTFVLFFQINVDFNFGDIGYTIIQYSPDGEILKGVDRPYELIGGDIFRGWDIEVAENGDFWVFGQIGGAIFLDHLNSELNQIINSSILDGTGEAGNACPGDLARQGDEFAAFYDDFPDVKMRTFTDDPNQPPRVDQFISIRDSNGLGEGNFIVDAVPTQDGGYLVLNELVRQNNFTGRGEVVKVNSQGTLQWTYEVDGLPTKILESSDGGVLLLYNPQFNQLAPKTTLIKLSSDGKL